jgi:hypothetical protein
MQVEAEVQVGDEASSRRQSFKPSLMASSESTVTLLPTFPIPVRDEPVGGRLEYYWENWAVMGADPWVITILQKGHKWVWLQEPPLVRQPVWDSMPKCPKKCAGMHEEIQKLLDKEAVELVSDWNSPGFYSRFFVVPKKEEGKWRSILDLSQLNLFIGKEKFKMDTAETIREHLHQGEWATSLDLTDAYRHIPIHAAFRKFLRFGFNQQVYQYKTLPMGLTTSPRVFTRVIKCITQFLHRHLIQVHQYLDDWLIHADSKVRTQYHTKTVVELTRHLGFIVNLDKSELEPSQDITFLAYRFHLARGLVYPTEERWVKIQQKIHPFMLQPKVRAREWQSMTGVLTATEKLVHLGMLHLRPIQVGMLDQWSPFRDSQAEWLIVTSTVRKALEWWLHRDNVMAGVPIRTVPPQFQVFSDASLKGWGGHLDGMEAQGVWTVSETKFHINVLEMLAVWRVLQAFVQTLVGSQVMVASDNTTTVAYIRRQGGTRSSSLLALTQEFFAWLEIHQITISCRHVPGSLNVLADSLSRAGEIIATEWSIHPGILDWLWTSWEKPQLDMFATRANFKLPLYVSPIPDPGAVAVDALSMDWTNLYMYMFPPTAILSKVLTKLQTVPCSVVLIAPAWPRQRWFPDILELLIDYPLRLPLWSKLLKQPRSSIFHQTPSVYHLHAWKLSSVATKIEGFQDQLLTEWQEHRKSQVSASMKASGEDSVIGVRRGVPIRSRLLCS